MVPSIKNLPTGQKKIICSKPIKTLYLWNPWTFRNILRPFLTFLIQYSLRKLTFYKSVWPLKNFECHLFNKYCIFFYKFMFKRKLLSQLICFWCKKNDLKWCNFGKMTKYWNLWFFVGPAPPVLFPKLWLYHFLS